MSKTSNDRLVTLLQVYGSLANEMTTEERRALVEEALKIVGVNA